MSVSGRSQQWPLTLQGIRAREAGEEEEEEEGFIGHCLAHPSETTGDSFVSSKSL